MGKYDYPELIKKGTVVGPVTKDMRTRCQQKVREVNRMQGLPDHNMMECWPDMIPFVREEIKKMGKSEWKKRYINLNVKK